MAAVLCGGFISMGAAFAPLGPASQCFFDQARSSLPIESKRVSSLMGASFSSHRDAVVSHLEELVLTHRAISVSA